MIAAIIQARTNSSRFPNKIFTEIAGLPLIWHVVNRLRKSKLLDEIIIATTINKADDQVVSWANQNNIKIFRGSEDNVLKRYFEAANYFNIDTIVRITADDPFKDYQIMDMVIKRFFEERADLATNNNPPSYPEGLDIEVFSFAALRDAVKKASSEFEKEHVTQHFYLNPQCYRIVNMMNNTNLSHLRWTIDEEKDLQMAQNVYNELFNNDKNFLMQDIIDLIKQKPEIAQINNTVKRSEMYKNIKK